MTSRILAEAEAEIDGARSYLNEQSPGLGLRFLDDLAERLDAIAETPLRFPKLETLTGDHPYQRARLSRFRYAVIYEILPQVILIVAVAHTSREPNYWLGRTS